MGELGRLGLRIRDIVTHYVHGRPHKDRNPRMCLCVWLLQVQEFMLNNAEGVKG